MLTTHFRSTSRVARCLSAASLLAVFAAVPALSAVAADVHTHNIQHHFSQCASTGGASHDFIHHFPAVADNVLTREVLRHFPVVAAV